MRERLLYCERTLYPRGPDLLHIIGLKQRQEFGLFGQRLEGDIGCPGGNIQFECRVIRPDRYADHEQHRQQTAPNYCCCSPQMLHPKLTACFSSRYGDKKPPILMGIQAHGSTIRCRRRPGSAGYRHGSTAPAAAIRSRPRETGRRIPFPVTQGPEWIYAFLNGG